MIKKTALGALFFLFMTVLCSYTFIFCKRQGIKGYVYIVTGNQMPSPDVKKAPPKPFRTTVYIHELTNISQVTQSADPSFYSSIQTKLVKQVMPDKKGYFKVHLEPGQYSLFIKKDNLYYSNLFDEKNNIAPVLVNRKAFTETVIWADYDAVY